jgi:hydrogenase nickel incorporation protein HypB
MCGICGCGGAAHEHEPGHSRNHGHRRSHEGFDLLRIETDILAKNNRFATANRRRLKQAGVFALNLVSSPGSGKTTLLVETIKGLTGKVPVAVIEGDQQTSLDADRIRAAGAPAFQINTRRACHLDAHMVGHAIDELPLRPGTLLFIENVGNLVCPAWFDLGESHRITILSSTEGDDKPLKYPDAFATADTMVLTKTDLLPYLDFDVRHAVANARAINPNIGVMEVSARAGEGMQNWLSWLETSARGAGFAHPIEAPSHA